MHTAQWSHVALHSLWGPGWATDTLYTNTLIIAFFYCSVLLLMLRWSRMGSIWPKALMKAMHLVAIFYPRRDPDCKRNHHTCFVDNPWPEHKHDICTYYSIPEYPQMCSLHQYMTSFSRQEPFPPASIHSLTGVPFRKISLKWHYSGDWNYHFIEQKIAIEFGAE